jgi:ATP-dependent phosphoenolpyruvate carboxykinase
LYNKVTTYLADKEVFVRDACSDPNYRLNVRVITETQQIYFATICFAEAAELAFTRMDCTLCVKFYG